MARVNYKKGDKVRCIKESLTGFFGKLGEIYTVSGINGPAGIYLEEDPRGMSGCSLDTNRFRLVKDHPVASDLTQWFDERLDKPEPAKKERVPDELDWEAHKAYMRGLK